MTTSEQIRRIDPTVTEAQADDPAAFLAREATPATDPRPAAAIEVGSSVRRKRGKQHLGTVVAIRAKTPSGRLDPVTVAVVRWKGGSRFGGAQTEVRLDDLIPTAERTSTRGQGGPGPTDPEPR